MKSLELFFQGKKMHICLAAGLSACLLLASFSASAQEVQAKFSASETTGCEQLVVDFKDESAGNPTSWQWDFGNGTTSTKKDPSTTYGQPGTYTVTLTVNNGATQGSASQIITVYVAPKADFTFDPPSGCYPLPVQFTDNTQPGTGNITNWTWDFGDGSEFSSSQNPAHTYDAAGTFNVKLTVKNSAGCETSSSVKRVVTNEGVTVDFTADKTFSCGPPLAVNFTASTSSPESITYHWDFGDGSTGTGQAPSHNYTQAGKYTVTLTAAVNGGGCQDQVIKQDYIYVGVMASDFEIPQGCANVPLAFKNTSVPAPVSATWDFGDGTTSTAINPKHTYQKAGTYTVTLTNDFGGCRQSVEKTFTTYPSPKAILSADPQQYCGIPAVVNFKNSSTGGAAWKWRFGDGDSSAQQQPQHTYAQGGNYDVTLIATSDKGCVDSVQQLGYIQVDAPDIDFTASPGFGCVGTTATSTFSVPDAADISSFKWEFGDGTTSTAANPTHTFGKQGSFTVKLTVVTKNSCTFSRTKTDYVHIGTKPKVDFSTDQTVACLDTVVQFTNLSVPEGTLWSWSFPQDRSTDTAETPLHQFSTLGPQDVILTVNNNGCEATLTKKNFVTISPPQASFKATLVSCSDPFTYHFEDASTGADSWTWDFGDGKVHTGRSLDYTFTGAGGKKVILTVSNGSCTSSYTGWVQVAKENPTLSLSDNTICHGSKVTLSMEPFKVAQYVKSITWNDGMGNSRTISDVRSDGNQFSFSYEKNGTFTPSVTLTYITGCTESFTGPVLTVEGPTAGYKASENVLCQGSTVTFTDNSTPNPAAAAIRQWAWDFDDGSTETVTTPQIEHPFTRDGIFQVTLEVTDANGCTDRTTGTQQITRVTVNPSSANFIAFDTTVCPGTPVQWQNRSNGGASPHYQWDFGDGTSADGAAPQHTYTADGAYTISLKLTTDQGCTDSLTRSDYITVGTPEAVMKNPDDVKICRILKDTAISLSRNYDNILWDFGDGTTSTLDTSYHIYNIPGTYTQRLTVNGYSDGCQATVEKEVIIAGPIGTPVITNATGCAPLSVDFTAEDVERAVTYQWFFGNGATSPEQQSPEAGYTYQQQGLFHPTLKLTDDTGCYVIVPIMDTLSVVADSINLTPVYSWPEICDSNRVLFNAEGAVFSMDSLGEDADYFWDFGDPANRMNGVSNAQSPSYRYPEEGIYHALLKVTTVYGCTASIPFEVTVPDSVALSVSAAADPLAICQGDLIQLQASSNIGERYVWTPAASLNDPLTGNPVAQPAANTTYQVIAYSPGDCQSDTADVNVTVHDLPQVDAGPDIIAATGSAVQLAVKGSSDVVQWSWSPADYLNCTHCATPTSMPTENMVYTVTGANGFGCESSDTVNVSLVCDQGKVFIPNSFSPNGDGANDLFYPRGAGVKNIVYFRIYNRFGQLVFERDNLQLNDASSGWDGTFKGEKLNPGVFVYVTSMICDDNKRFQLSGNITLLK